MLFVSGPVNVVGLAAGHGVATLVRYASHSPFAHCWSDNQVNARVTCGSVTGTFAAFERGEREALAERTVVGRVLHAEQTLVLAREALGREEAVHEVVRHPGAVEVPGVLAVGDRGHDEVG